MTKLGSTSLNFIFLCSLVACGESTAGVDQIPNIDGNWTYNLSFSGNGTSCVYDASAVTINQTGGTFTGRIEIPDATCTPQGGASFSLGDFGSDIVNGTINAAGEIAFDWGVTDTAHHTGTASPISMSGTMTGDDDTAGIPDAVTGPWSASR